MAFFTTYRAGVGESLTRRELSRGWARILSIIVVLASLVRAIILAILVRAIIWAILSIMAILLILAISGLIWAILLCGVGVWPWPVEISHG